MFEEIIQLTGKNHGSVSIILAGVHGNETCGIAAIKKILPNLKIERGSVMFGYGNPRAIKANQRYVEANLNRMFNNAAALSAQDRVSYEYHRAQVLKNYLNKAEALLDLHASSIPNSKPFAICESNAVGIVKFFPVDLVVSGFDQVEPGATDYYMNRLEKIGICLECGYIKNLRSTKIATEGILAFLKARGHLTNNLVPNQQSYVRMYKKYFARTNNFTLAKPFENFELVKKNQLIGTDGLTKIKATKQSLILFAHHGNKIGAEVFLLGEKKKALA